MFGLDPQSLIKKVAGKIITRVHRVDDLIIIVTEYDGTEVHRIELPADMFSDK